jgi:hypothetical protein
MNARRILTAQAVLVGGALAALILRELPGIMREARIFRIVGVSTGARHTRHPRHGR